MSQENHPLSQGEDGLVRGRVDRKLAGSPVRRFALGFGEIQPRHTPALPWISHERFAGVM